MPMIITIDGPAGSGKSAVAKAVAQTLGFLHVDTGAMYRAVTYAILSHQVDIADAAQLDALLHSFSFTMKAVGPHQHYWLDEEDITETIRSTKVTSFVSEVSALLPVRQRLVTLQRQIAVHQDAVFEGRDLGTVVFPDAQLKIFLVARPEIRAQRRYQELQATSPHQIKDKTLEVILNDINRRDLYDSTRALSPLKPHPQAHLIDTSDLTIDQVVSKILTLLSRS